MSTFDRIRFAQRLDEIATAEMDTVRAELTALAGPDILAAVAAAIRPRILQIELAVHGEAHDGGAAWRQRPSAIPGPIRCDIVDRDALEQMCIVTTAFTAAMLRWWSAATDVPAGLEDLWWIASNVLEAAEDNDSPDDIAELEAHLRATVARARRIEHGHANDVRAELGQMWDSELRTTFLETGEDLAQLLQPMGATETLDNIHEGPP